MAAAAPTVVVSMLGAAPSAMCGGPDFDGNKNLVVRASHALDPGGGVLLLLLCAAAEAALSPLSRRFPCRKTPTRPSKEPPLTPRAAPQDAAKAAGVRRFVLVSALGAGNSLDCIPHASQDVLGPWLAQKTKAEEHLQVRRASDPKPGGERRQRQR